MASSPSLSVLFPSRGVAPGWRDATGAVTAEYAVVLLAAVAFAGLLATVLRSGAVQVMLADLVQKALTSV